ncbi:hypothetical protein BAE44_0003151, partial [Dichanthelium oligosanthes]
LARELTEIKGAISHGWTTYPAFDPSVQATGRAGIRA